MNAIRPRVWLLSAYHAASHAQWADRLVELHSGLDWRRFELPGRHFAWRIRGNPLSWLDAFDGPAPAALVATSMVDLATIRGLQPALAGVPALLYFHENQFAYPQSDRQITSVEAQMVQFYAALAADRVLFNSVYNRDTFLEGVDGLLARMPDGVPAGLGDRLASKAAVIPVPVPLADPSGLSPSTPPSSTGPACRDRDRRLILWNHRWEYDKDPDTFAEALLLLDRRGVDFRLALLGPRGARPVPALQRLRSALGNRIVVDDAPPRIEYERILSRAGIVVSTARHEFQGLAVMEAVRAGCLPLVPDALCFPEFYPSDCRYEAGNALALAARLEQWLSGSMPGRPDLRGLEPELLASAWRSELGALLQGARRRPQGPDS